MTTLARLHFMRYMEHLSNIEYYIALLCSFHGINAFTDYYYSVMLFLPDPHLWSPLTSPFSTSTPPLSKYGT